VLRLGLYSTPSDPRPRDSIDNRGAELTGILGWLAKTEQQMNCGVILSASRGPENSYDYRRFGRQFRKDQQVAHPIHRKTINRSLEVFGLEKSCSYGGKTEERILPMLDRPPL